MRRALVIVAAMSLTFGIARATPTVTVGNHTLLPGLANQSFTIPVSGGDAVQGENVDVQVADGGPPAGGTIVGPAITNLDLVTGTIFTPNNSGQQNPPPNQIVPQFRNASVVTTGSGTVSASGTLASVTFDTTPASAGVYALRLGNTLNGSTDFAGVNANITNGNLIVLYPGDANMNGAVDFSDLLTHAQHYGSTSGSTFATGDFNFDGSVGFDDLLLLAQNYGKSLNLNPPPPASPALSAAAVPEPASVFVVFVASLCLCLRRTQRMATPPGPG